MWTMRRVRRASALCVGLGLASLSAPAYAEPAARLDYSRGPGAERCPEAAELERAVNRGLGENPFDPGAASAYEVRIFAEGSRLVGLVTLRGPDGGAQGSRRFESAADRCDELVSALALAIGITLNPELALEPPGSAKSEAEGPVEQRATPAAPATTGAPRDERARVVKSALGHASRSGVELGLETHAALGPGPAPTGGFGLFGRLRKGAFSGALEARYDAPASRELLEGSIHSTLAGGSAVPCFHFGPAFACGVLLLANVSAGSEGVSNQRSDSGLFVAAGPRLGFGLEVGEAPLLRIEGRWDALFPLTPVSMVQDGETVWEGAPVAATLGAAAAWLVP